MAYFIVRNSLNPNKAVKFSVTLQQQVLKDSEGEHIWTAEINTLEPSSGGTQLTSKYLHLRTLDNLDEELEKASAELCEQINWSPLSNDTRAPYVTGYSPAQQAMGVDIDSLVEVVLEESLPSTGINQNSIAVSLNGFDITNEVEITGDPYEYILKWKPSIIVRDEY